MKSYKPTNNASQNDDGWHMHTQQTSSQWPLLMGKRPIPKGDRWSNHENDDDEDWPSADEGSGTDESEPADFRKARLALVQQHELLAQESSKAALEARKQNVMNAQKRHGKGDATSSTHAAADTNANTSTASASHTPAAPQDARSIAVSWPGDGNNPTRS